MNAASGPTATIITPTATTTAMTMIGKCSVMPTAVMMLSTEKTMSIMMIWMRPEKRPSGEPGFSYLSLIIRIDAVVDFARRLPDQEQSARQQKQVAQGKGVSEHDAQRLREMHDPRRRSEQREAEYERQRQAKLAREAPSAFVDAVREQRNEHQIVEAEHDLHGDQGRERRPRVWVLRQAEKFVHARVGPQSLSFDPTPTAGAPI